MRAVTECPAVDVSPEVFDAVCAELAGVLSENFGVAGMTPGSISNCYELLCDSGRRLAFKVPRDGRSLSYEIDILRRAETCGLTESGLLPRLVAEVAGGCAYAAEFVPGLTVRRALRAGPVAVGVAQQVVDGLRLYHEGIGETYQDFHEDNVILDGSRVRFIDPGAWPPHPTWSDLPPLVGDIADWVSWSSARMPLEFLRQPGGTWRRFRLNIDVATLAVQPEARALECLWEIRGAALGYLDSWMPTANWRRDRIAHRPAKWLVRLTIALAWRRVQRERPSR